MLPSFAEKCILEVCWETRRLSFTPLLQLVESSPHGHMQNQLLREAVIPSHVPSQNRCDTICPGWSTGAQAMPRKAGEVLFISQGRDAKMTLTVPGRGSIALQLVLEALSWKKGICSCFQKSFRFAAFTDPLQSPLLKQRKPPPSQLQEFTSACCSPAVLHASLLFPQHSRTGRAGSQRVPWGSSTGSITQAALEQGSVPGWQGCPYTSVPHVLGDADPSHCLPSPEHLGTEKWFLILAKGDWLTASQWLAWSFGMTGVMWNIMFGIHTHTQRTQRTREQPTVQLQVSPKTHGWAGAWALKHSWMLGKAPCCLHTLTRGPAAWFMGRVR